MEETPLTHALARFCSCSLRFFFFLVTTSHVVAQVEPPDYPKLLACADLGVSLHTSTSGMDLPIKILDYFGCEVPVCAYQFECLHELVQDNVNGRTFTTAPQLATLLYDLLSPLADAKRPTGNHDFGKLKQYSLQIQGRALWSENWPKYAKPLLEGIVQQQQNNNNKEDGKDTTAATTKTD